MFDIKFDIYIMIGLVARLTIAEELVFHAHQTRDPVRDPGQPCCFPNCEGQASMLYSSLQGGSLLAGSSGAKVAFDNDNFKAAAHGVGTDQDPTANVSMIVDYTAGVVYIVQPKSQQCSTVQLPYGMMGTCVPDDADYTYLGRGTLGYGSKTLPFDGFFVDGNQAGVDVKFQAVVTPDKCAPVQVIMWGGAGTMGLSFFNTTAGVKDPSVFKVPSYCNGGPKAAAAAPTLSPVLEALKQVFMVMGKKK